MDRHVGDHDPRHAVRAAAIAGIVALAAGRDVGEAGVQNGLEFRLRADLLAEALGLRRIELPPPVLSQEPVQSG